MRLLLPYWSFSKKITNLYKYSETLTISKWPIEHGKWETENVCKTIGISFLEKAVCWQQWFSISAFILFKSRPKWRNCSSEEKPVWKGSQFPLSSPYIMYACGRAPWGNKQAIDCNDYSLFIPVIKWKTGHNIRFFFIKNLKKNWFIWILLHLKQ